MPGPDANEQMVTAVPPDVPSAFNMYGGVKPVTSIVNEPSVAEVAVFSTDGDEESLSRIVPTRGAPVAATPDTAAAVGVPVDVAAVEPPPPPPQPANVISAVIMSMIRPVKVLRGSMPCCVWSEISPLRAVIKFPP